MKNGKGKLLGETTVKDGFAPGKYHKFSIKDNSEQIRISVQRDGEKELTEVLAVGLPDLKELAGQKKWGIYNREIVAATPHEMLIRTLKLTKLKE